MITVTIPADIPTILLPSDSGRVAYVITNNGEENIHVAMDGFGDPSSSMGMILQPSESVSVSAKPLSTQTAVNVAKGPIKAWCSADNAVTVQEWTRTGPVEETAHINIQ